MRRGLWSTRWGFYFAAVGSAFSLANLWRFPYIAGTSGGGAFVLFYILMVVTLGLPLLVGELILGKTTRSSLVKALTEVEDLTDRERSLARWVGRAGLAASLILLSYYAVVSGWVLHFLLQYLVGLFQDVPHSLIFRKLMDNGPLQIALAAMHLFLCGLVVGKGVQQGIERWIGYVIPLFGALLIFLTYQSLFLSGATEALRFLFYPDFSEVSGNTFIRAIGHALFTLSLGVGAMVAFGSYLKDEAKIPGSGLRVALLNTAISLCVGILIFPIVFTGGLRVDAGPTLLFETIPLLLNKIGLGDVFGMAFFLCLYAAAFGASIGLLEATVSHRVDRHRAQRNRATWMMAGVAFVISVLPALSSSSLEGVQISGQGVLQLLDSLMIHLIIPVVSLGVALVVGYRLKMKALRGEFVWDGKESTLRLFRNWLFVLRVWAPLLIGLALILEILSLF